MPPLAKNEPNIIGVRIIYFNKLANRQIWLLVIYTKAVRGSIPAHLLKAIKETIEHE